MQSSDYRDCMSAPFADYAGMDKVKSSQPEVGEVWALLSKAKASQRELADALGLAQNKVSKIRSGERRLTAGEYRKAVDWLSGVIEKDGYRETADLPDIDGTRDYLAVEVLPSYGGMGGGGTGEGDKEQALIPRHLVEDELRARPADLLLIEARGESMMPDFQNGDQILIDRRDNNPVRLEYSRYGMATAMLLSLSNECHNNVGDIGYSAQTNGFPPTKWRKTKFR